MQTIVTMTSWRGRIQFVGRSIFRFFTTQTELPDIFYLWLAEEEFPNKEKDLPEDLLFVANFFKIKISWLKENEYNFKRWHVYPMHYEDLVVSIDDDMIFDYNLIKVAKTKMHERNCVYNIFKCFTYEYFPSETTFGKLPTAPSSSKYNWLGCSIVCPGTFPCECMTPENLKLRQHACKRCDETWIKPFSLMHDTKIGFLDFASNHDDATQDVATNKILCRRVNEKRLIDYQWFYRVYVMEQSMKDKFFQTFPAYKSVYENFKRTISAEAAHEILETNQ